MTTMTCREKLSVKGFIVISLIPFEVNPLTRHIEITADVARKSSTSVILSFEITGALDTIAWPEEMPLVAERQDLLWQKTCLEAFFSPSLSSESPYAEVNCAPHGHWNLYTLSSYRQNLQTLEAGKVTLVNREQIPEGLHFSVLVEGLPWPSPLHVGLTAVLKHTNGQMSYWALSHAEKQADFHSKKSFDLTV
jgi:hypothetical protein